MLKLVPGAPNSDEERGGRHHDDDSLMLLCAAGDSASFAELMRRHERQVRRYLSRMIGQAEARDLCQETFLELWRTRDQYRAQGRFTVLLYRIARNKAYSHLRWRGVRAIFARQARESQPAPQISRDSGLEVILRSERETIVNQVLSGLPTKLREAVVLHHAAGLDYETIASITRVPEGTLRARAHRGLCLLRERLARREER